jgi:hypothetical protein
MNLYCIKNHKLELDYHSSIYIYHCVNKECWIEETKERKIEKYPRHPTSMKVSRHQLVLSEDKRLFSYHLDYPDFGIELSNTNFGNGKCRCNFSLGSRYEYHDCKHIDTLYGENDQLPEVLQFDYLDLINSYEKLKRKIKLYKTFC